MRVFGHKIVKFGFDFTFFFFIIFILFEAEAVSHLMLSHKHQENIEKCVHSLYGFMGESIKFFF